MLGYFRKVVENFDLRRYPHEIKQDSFFRYSDEDKKDPNIAHIADHGHLKSYSHESKGYTTIYDVGVYIIVLVFMCVLVREVFIMFKDENNKSYMSLCLLIIVICAVLY